MSLNTLHLNDLESPQGSKVDSNRTRRVAAIVTAAVVVLLGSAMFLMSDNPPRSIPSGTAAGPNEVAADGTQSVPAGASSPLATGALAPTAGTIATSSTPSTAGAVATVAVPAGTKLSLEIAESVTSADAIVGKELVATLSAPVMVDGKVAIEAGTKVMGRVTETLELSKTSGNGIFAVVFDRLEIDGQSTPIVAELRGQKQLELAPGRILELELSRAVQIPAIVEPAPAG